MSYSTINSTNNIVTWLQDAKHRSSSSTVIHRRHVQSHPSFSLDKLKLVSSLRGHTGSVNRLAWDEDGSFLASCSDDLHVCIWSLENCARPVGSFQTSHTNNILGIKFMPQCESQVLLTGACDGLVEMHHLAADRSDREKSDKYYCHRNRVRYVETEPMNPHVFFSAGDDG